MSVTDDAILNGPDGAYLCVLASGSGGNCSVLAVKRGSVVRLCLIDVGISPRRVVLLLAQRGLRPDQIDDVILTHLDADHCYATWRRRIPDHATLRLHRAHAADAERGGWRHRRVAPFEEPFDMAPGVRVSPVLMAHDEHGTASFRIDLPEFGGASLGFATDLGRVTPDLVERFRDVDVLAIESNYCPRMQEDSGRPWFLQRRITGGRGHLSNGEALAAISAIQPREHVVLLHLSRQCNCPDLVRGLHAGSWYGCTIAHQERATPWVRVSRGRPRPARAALPAVEHKPGAGTLWEHAAAGAVAG